MIELIAQIDAHRKEFRANGFFSKLRRGELDHMRWMWQLWYWSGWFTRALSTRSGLSEDARFSEVFADHAVQEGNHPRQLKQFMKKQGFDMDFGPVPTPETVTLRDSMRAVAGGGNALEQVMVMNVLGEGLALDFYTAVTNHFGDRVYGPYWHVHQEVDDIHRMMGVDLLPTPEPERIVNCSATVTRIYNEFNAMVESWAI